MTELETDGVDVAAFGTIDLLPDALALFDVALFTFFPLPPPVAFGLFFFVVDGTDGDCSLLGG